MDRRKLQEAIAQNRHFTPTRKVSLYANFSRLEETNPDGYEANILAWREVLEDCVANGGFADRSCIEAGPELVSCLSDPVNGLPLSLYCVLDRMMEENAIVPLDRFKQMYPATPSGGIATKVFGWMVHSVLPRGKQSSKDKNGDTHALRHEKYVDMRAITQNSESLVRSLESAAAKQGNSLLSKIYDFEQVKELAGSQYSSLDIELLLAYASRQGLINYNQTLNVVKLRAAGPITETDSAITSLRMQINELTRREESLNDQIKEYENKAREAVKTNRKAAKQYLQKKQTLEKSYGRTLSSLDQLESVLHKIDDASDNKQAYEALQSSSHVLSEFNKGLSVDDVDSLIERLQDAAAETDEVSTQLADLNLNADREVEDMELDSELQELADEEAAKKVTNLPSAPQHRPAKVREEVDEPVGETPREQRKEGAELLPQ